MPRPTPVTTASRSPEAASRRCTTATTATPRRTPAPVLCRSGGSALGNGNGGNGGDGAPAFIAKASIGGDDVSSSNFALVGQSTHQAIVQVPCPSRTHRPSTTRCRTPLSDLRGTTLPPELSAAGFPGVSRNHPRPIRSVEDEGGSVKKSRIMMPVAAAAVALTLVFLVGLAAGADGAGDQPRAQPRQPAPTLGRRPHPGTTTDPGTHRPRHHHPIRPTTTAPVDDHRSGDDDRTGHHHRPGHDNRPRHDDGAPNYDDPGTTTTTGPTVTAANTLPASTESTTQSTPTSSAATTTVAAPPTAPCDTTQLTCGNNASTQVAIVSQTCVASSQNTTLNVEIQTLGGTPVNNVTISPTTTCLNTLQITQLVEQYCVGCTVIVIPPPPPTPPVIYVPEPGTNTITVVQTPAPPPPVRVQAYCMPHAVALPNGTTGSLVYLAVGEPQRNPVYAAAVPATFVPGIGMKCPTATTARATVPVFTLTVPASFVGQSLRLCLQPAAPAGQAALPCDSHRPRGNDHRSGHLEHHRERGEGEEDDSEDEDEDE